MSGKKITFSRKGLLAGLALAILAPSLAGCVAYVPGPPRVAYVAPAPVVVVHPYYYRWR